jgi:hypothetical protein
LLNNFTVAQAKDGDISEGNRFTCRVYAIHRSGMSTLNTKLNNNVITIIDSRLYLFAMVGQPKPDTYTCSNGLNILKARSSPRESIVGHEVICLKLRHWIYLPVGPDDVVGFSDHASI